MLGLSSGNPIRRVLAGVVLLYGPIAAFMVWWIAGGDARYGSLLALLLTVVGLAGVVALLLFAQVYERDVRRLLEGEHWAHWRFAADEWERFDQQQSARDRREARDVLAWALVFGLILGAIIALLGAGIPGFWIELALLCAAGVWVASVAASYGWLDHRRRRRDPDPMVYIGPRGVHRPEGYVTLVGLGRRLARVKLVAGDPATIRFDVREATRGSERQYDVWVPVPRGREGEGDQLVARFGREHGCTTSCETSAPDSPGHPPSSAPA